MFNSADTPPSRRSIALFYFLICISVFIVGSVIGSRAALIPTIRSDIGISYTQLGLFLFLNSIAFSLSFFIGGAIADRWNDKKIMIVSCMLIAAALLCFGLIGSFAMLIVVIFATSFGSGGIDMIANVMGGKFFTTHAALKMNVLHFFFGVGASIAPFIATRLVTQGVGWRTIHMAIGLIMLPCALLWICLRMPYRQQKIADPIFRNIVKIMKSPHIWIYGLLSAAALITELSLVDWLSEFLQRTRDFSVTRSGTLLSMFYLIFTVSRLFNGFISDRIGFAWTVAVYGVGASICFLGALLFAEASFLFVIAGIFVSVLFPTVILITARRFSSRAGTAIGFIILIGGVLQALFNSLVGGLQDLFGVAIGFSVIGAGFGAVVILGLILLTMEKDMKK